MGSHNSHHRQQQEERNNRWKGQFHAILQHVFEFFNMPASRIHLSLSQQRPVTREGERMSPQQQQRQQPIVSFVN